MHHDLRTALDDKYQLLRLRETVGFHYLNLDLARLKKMSVSKTKKRNLVQFSNHRMMVAGMFFLH